MELNRLLLDWLKFFILIVVVSASIIFPLLFSFENTRIDVIQSRERPALDVAEYIVGSMFHERAGDIQVLAQAPGVRRYLNNETKLADTAISELFEAFCRSYAHYDQVRLLALNGNELFRVNYNNGLCQSTPETELQNKQDRYYFSEALKLKPGQLFISKLDLNIEHGKLEMPYKPMIRFAMPVSDENGETKAVIVLNYLARNLLNEVFHNQPDDTNHSDNYSDILVNDQGYYLKFHNRPEMEFGFMLGHENDRLSIQYPDVWQAIQRGQTSVHTDAGIFLIKQLGLPVVQGDTLSETTKPLALSTHWYVLRLITNESLHSASILFGPKRWLWFSLYLLIVMLTSALMVERRLQRNKLVDINSMVQALFDQSPGGILSVDSSGTIMSTNDRVCAMFGYQQDELIGQSVDILIPERFRSSHPGFMMMYMQAPELRDMSSRTDIAALRKDGSELYVNISLNPVVIQKKRLVVCSIMDVSERREAETLLKQSQQRLALATQSSEIGIWDWDVTNNELVWDDAMFALYGCSRERLPNPFDVWQLRVHPDDRNIVEQKLKDALDGRSPFDTEFRILADNGKVSYIKAMGRVFHANDGRASRMLGTNWDVTEEKRAESALLRARRDAEKANQAKTLFLANMSHEIRTPLNSIIGQTWLLKHNEALTESIKSALNKIETAGQLLLSQVNDILDMSKIEAKEVTLEALPVRLDSMLVELTSLLSDQAQEKGIELTVKPLPDAAATCVIGDLTRLRQIFLNLLSNAIKFTEQGYVSLSVELIGNITENAVGKQKQTLCFRVEDTGIGISDSALTTLFEPFKQADEKTTRQYGGTGLGLTIVKELTSLMGGNVQVESSLGNGSCFTVTLPFINAREDELAQAGISSAQMYMLVAEDDPAQRTHLLNLCQVFGWTAEAFADGDALLKRYAELDRDGKSIDCLVLDWRMPKMDGLQVLHQLHQIYEPEHLPCTLVVTAYERQQLSRLPDAALADAVMVKPIDISDFFDNISAAFSKHYGDARHVIRSTHIANSRLKWLPGVRVLLVDDSPINLEVASGILSHHGADVSSCHNGQEAIKWLDNPEHHADIVLMDIQMPVMDGNKAVEAIRQDDRFKALPVIALTAGVLESEREKSLQAGMDDYLTKPFEPEKMLFTIRKWVEARQALAIDIVEQEDKLAEFDSWPSIKGINIEALRTRTNDNKALCQRLLVSFIETNKDIEQLSFVTDETTDLPTLQARIHKFAGSAGTLSADEAHHIAKELENRLRDNQLDDIPQRIEALSVCFKGLKLAITSALESTAFNSQRDNDKATVMTDEKLYALREALANNKISAVKLYHEVEAALQSSLSQDDFALLHTAMTKLDFTTAVKMLESLMKTD